MTVDRWSRRRLNLDRVFWTRVRPDESGCWLWTGATQGGPRRYGLVRRFGKWILAHRHAYSIINGPVPDGLFVCHHCDTPLCVRPDHLFVGTHMDNMRDMDAKGRRVLNSVRGADHGCAKLTQTQVEAIRRDYRFRSNTYRMLAVQYGVHKDTVRRIVVGLSW